MVVMEVIEVSLVLPAYNEARRLRNTVDKVALRLMDITRSFEIIIAEDGATDGTDRVAKELAQELHYVKHLHSDTRLGRGKALIVHLEPQKVIYWFILMLTSQQT